MSALPSPSDRLHLLLDELEGGLDLADEAARDELHRRALSYEPVDRLPVVVMCSEPLPTELQPYSLSEAVNDPEKMLFNELVTAWETSIARRAEIGDDLPATVRANFGTVLVPSCFGATIDQPEDAPAWVRHFEDPATFDRAIAQGPNLDSQWISRAVEAMEFFSETLSSYDALSEIIKITIPDLQGPLDNAAMLRGSDIFLDIITDPGRFTAALEATTATQLELWKRFSTLTQNEPEGYVHQHGVLVSGGILIRNDSSVMLSPEMYRERVAPFDEAVMNAVGGGALHSCGRIDHLLPIYLDHPSVRTIDFGQSWMNDVDNAYQAASARNVPLVRLHAEKAELEGASILDRFPTGVILTHMTEDLAATRRTMDKYRDAAANRTAGR